MQAVDFTGRVPVNGTDYRLLEQTKVCIYKPSADPATGTVEPPHRFVLRRVVLWNLHTNHRISVLG